MPPCNFSGLICCYAGVDLTTCPPPDLLCSGELRLIFIDFNCCLAKDKPAFPVGMIKEEGKICKVGTPILTSSIFAPDMKNLLKIDFGLLCVTLEGQLPFGGPTPSPICAIYGLQCALKDGKPVFGCCTGPYEGGVGTCTGSGVHRGGPQVEEMSR